MLVMVNEKREIVTGWYEKHVYKEKDVRCESGDICVFAIRTKDGRCRAAIQYHKIGNAEGG